MLSLRELLNPTSPEAHEQPRVHRFTTPNPPESPHRTNSESYPRALSSPPSLQREQLSTPRFRNPISLSTPTLSPHGFLSFSQSANGLLSTRHDIRLNNKTMLSSLYHYKTGTILEYPHTSDKRTTSVGHLFELSPSQWHHPRLNFAYSQGSPNGQSKEGDHVYCLLLKHDRTGEKVPCRVTHYTCKSFIQIHYLHRFDCSSRPGMQNMPVCQLGGGKNPICACDSRFFEASHSAVTTAPKCEPHQAGSL